MSDTVPAPAFLDDIDGGEPLHVSGGMAGAPRRGVQRKPEWVRQAEFFRFLERVLLPPCEVRSIDQANAAMAHINTRMMALGRGCKPGTSDMMVWQGAPSLMVPIEVKHEGKERAGQTAFAAAMERCGFPVIRECRTTYQLHAGLLAAGFRLHGNTTNLAREYQERIEAGLRQLALLKSGSVKKPKRAAKARHTGRKGSPAQHARITAARLGI